MPGYGRYWQAIRSLAALSTSYVDGTTISKGPLALPGLNDGSLTRLRALGRELWCCPSDAGSWPNKGPALDSACLLLGGGDRPLSTCFFGRFFDAREAEWHWEGSGANGALCTDSDMLGTESAWDSSEVSLSAASTSAA